MARNLEKSQFYTLQVKWGAEIPQVDHSVRILPSFYAIHHNGKCSIKQSFKNTLISDEIRPAFYLGGFVSRTRDVSVLQQQRVDLSADNSPKKRIQTGQIEMLHGTRVQSGDFKNTYEERATRTSRFYREKAKREKQATPTAALCCCCCCCRRC